MGATIVTRSSRPVYDDDEDDDDGEDDDDTDDADDLQTRLGLTRWRSAAVRFTCRRLNYFLSLVGLPSFSSSRPAPELGRRIAESTRIC